MALIERAGELAEQRGLPAVDRVYVVEALMALAHPRQEIAAAPAGGQRPAGGKVSVDVIPLATLEAGAEFGLGTPDPW